MLQQTSVINDDTPQATGQLSHPTGIDTHQSNSFDHFGSEPTDLEEELWEEEDEEEEENEEYESDDSDTTESDDTDSDDTEETDDDEDDEEIKDPKAVLAKKKELQRKLKKAQTKLAEIEAERKKSRETKLKKQKNYEALVKDKDTEIDELKAKLGQWEKAAIETRTVSAFKRELGLPLPEKFEHLIPIDDIETTEDGKPDKAMVAKAVKQFRKEYPEIIDAVRKKSRTTPDAPGGDDSVPTYDEWMEMKPADKRKHMKAVMENEARTGT